MFVNFLFDLYQRSVPMKMKTSDLSVRITENHANKFFILCAVGPSTAKFSNADRSIYKIFFVIFEFLQLLVFPRYFLYWIDIDLTRAITGHKGNQNRVRWEKYIPSNNQITFLIFLLYVCYICTGYLTVGLIL
jgi:hypothetical protein